MTEHSYKYSSANEFQVSALNLMETSRENGLHETHIWKHLPCYVPTTIRYYPFSHLLVFLIHILPINIWGNQPGLARKQQGQCFPVWKTNCNKYCIRGPLLGKKRNKISNYLEKEQANLIDKNLLNINK